VGLQQTGRGDSQLHG